MQWPLTPALVVTAVLVSTVGCRHVGPTSVVDDRLAYNHAIATSWKEQALLNVVRDRYYDVIEYVDVSAINSGYQNNVSGSATLSAAISPHDSLRNLLSPGLGGTRSLSENPTITYTPQTGAEFMRNVLNPMPVASLASLIESGMRAEVVFGLAVEGINGIHNLRVFRGEVRPADPEFEEVMQILTDAQASSHITFRQTPATDNSASTVYLTFVDQDVPPDLAEKIARLRQILRLDPSLNEFKVIHGLRPQAKDEIAIRTRSVSRLINYLSINVDVPPHDLASGVAPDLGEQAVDSRPPLTVRSGPCPPADCFAAICYRDSWFWIDSFDTESKRTMIYLKRFQALADTGPKSAPPVLTIRAN